MARHQQWHSARDGERVHHDNEDCPDGQNIDYYWLRHHTGGRPLCANCARLNTAALLRPMPDAGDRPTFTPPR
jgi:hypothetical protein